MKKLAFFVEGQTELLFIKKLLIEISGANNIVIDSQKFIGKPGNTSHYKMDARSKISDEKFYVLITDCLGDTRVQSAVIDQHPSLVKADYAMILGLRDLFPNNYKDVEKVKKALKYKVPTKPIEPQILLSVMEIETWFLAQHSHLSRIHKNLTTSHVKTETSIDLENDDLEKISNPADTLHLIYSLAGKAYTKRALNTQRTIDALDFADIYISLNTKVVHLGYLITELDEFFK